MDFYALASDLSMLTKPIGDFLFNWQTLIAGILALIGAVVTVRALRKQAREDAERKERASPVTAADEEAEKLILARLAELAPGVPAVLLSAFYVGDPYNAGLR